MLKRVQHDKKKCVIPNLFRNLEFGNDKKLIAFASVRVPDISANGAAHVLQELKCCISWVSEKEKYLDFFEKVYQYETSVRIVLLLKWRIGARALPIF